MEHQKPKIPFNDLIERLKSHGIKFDIDSEESAKEFLHKHNYYLKITAYREDFRTEECGPNEGKYINLDFAYLRELSVIDMHLRYLILEMCLDIEHYLKVKLLDDAAYNEKEDGYETVKEFIEYEKSLSETNQSKAEATILSHRQSEYCKDLIDKYMNDIPIWVFLETISMNELFSFYDFYLNKYGKKNDYRILLNSVRDLRNASAHNNCLINRLRYGNNTPHGKVFDMFTKKYGIKTKNGNVNKCLKNKFLYDFAVLLIVYDDFVTSEASKEKCYKQLDELINIRMVRHKEWFKNNGDLTRSHQFIKILLAEVYCC